MKVLLGLLLLGSLTTFATLAAEGLIKKQSDYSVTETANRLEQLVKQKQLTLFARIDHATNASNANLSLPPTEILIFGNLKIGTPLMHCARSVAIDLPQKALVWQDDDAQVWLAYNDPEYLKSRHAIKGCDKYLTKVATVLGNLSERATKRETE